MASKKKKVQSVQVEFRHNEEWAPVFDKVKAIEYGDTWLRISHLDEDGSTLIQNFPNSAVQAVREFYD